MCEVSTFAPAFREVGAGLEETEKYFKKNPSWIWIERIKGIIFAVRSLKKSGQQTKEFFEKFT